VEGCELRDVKVWEKDCLFSPEPRVELVNAFDRPFDNAIATARTCYSARGIVRAEDVASDPDLRDRLARSIYRGGHHTVLQHAHFQFALSNVSRQFIWTFLHSHPFYNSEQVSQRYVRVHPEAVAVPPLKGAARSLYQEAITWQMAAYGRLVELVTPLIAEEYYRRFRARQGTRRATREVERRAQEIARYVLPLATHAYLYHTVSALTLFRYYRLCRQLDAPLEQQVVVGKMVEAVLALDPAFETILEEPIPLEETLEYRFFEMLIDGEALANHQAFVQEFDLGLEGHTSKLVACKNDNESILAQAVREVLGLPGSAMSDKEAIRLVLDPAGNNYLGEALNLNTMSKLTRAMCHPGYTFRKKLSHTADSQDQRHRMTPASRPTLMAYFGEEPDYITPVLVARNEDVKSYYEEVMQRIWADVRKLRRMGVSREFAAYLLPNALALRFTESADLLNFHHKVRTRLCYNAQEEIWRASLDEALQIGEVNPLIGRHFGAPCALRRAAGRIPYCPEEDRYCGVLVWDLGLARYSRMI
jgi:flavin-dependent thymidylate synthase